MQQKQLEPLCKNKQGKDMKGSITTQQKILEQRLDEEIFIIYIDCIVRIISIKNEDGQLDSIKNHHIQQEARRLSKCNHPHIFKHYDDFQIDKKYDITLQQWLQSHQQQPQDNLKLFLYFSLQILDAVEYLHSLNHSIGDISLRYIQLYLNRKILFCDQNFIKVLNTLIQQDDFLIQHSKDIYFYLPSEILIGSNLKQLNVRNKDKNKDIFIIGICLYVLTSPIFFNIQSTDSGVQLGQIEHNNHLYQSIKNIIETQPSISQVIQKFQDLQISLTQFEDNQIHGFENVSNQIYIENKDINQNFSKFDGQNKLTKNQISQDLYKKGLQFYDNKMYKDALLYLKNADELTPNSEIIQKIFQTYYVLQMYDEALKYYKKKNIDNFQNLMNAHFKLGYIYFKKLKYDNAILCFKQAIEINPKQELTYFYLGVSYQKIQKYDEAFKYYKLAIQINPNIDIAHYNLGSLYLMKQMIYEAIKCYEKSIEINPNIEETYNSLGLSFNRIAKYNQAILNFKKSIKINQNCLIAYNGLSDSYKYTQQYEKAIICCKKSIEINPNQVQLYNKLINIYKRTDQYDDAVLWFQKAIKLFPQSNQIKILSQVKQLI